MAICEALGDHLNRIRKDRGLSITEFSEELGIARSSLQAILNGTGNPRSDTIEHIAANLNIDYRTLLTEPADSTAPQLTEAQQKDLLLMLEQFSGYLGTSNE